MKVQKIWALMLGVLGFFLTSVVHAVPARIMTLTAISASSTSVALSFTMPAPGAGMTLTAVECRKSDIAITTLNWSTRSIAATPAPAPVGTLITFSASVTPGVTTYFGCKTKDTAWSLVSNVVSVATSVPITIDATLTWDPIVSERLAGFIGYWREKTGGVYDNNNKFQLDGNLNTTTVKVPYGLVWCFVLYAVYDNGTLIMGPSNEACKTSATQ